MKFRKVCYYIIMVLLLINFLFSAFYVCTYILDSREQKAEYDDLAALVEQVRQEQRSHNRYRQGHCRKPEHCRMQGHCRRREHCHRERRCR